MASPFESELVAARAGVGVWSGIKSGLFAEAPLAVAAQVVPLDRPGVFRVPVEDKLAALPPDGNTGAVTSKGLVDWLACTFHERSLEHVKLLFGAGQDWQAADRGGLGYVSCLFRGDVRVYYAGSVGMGVHVEVTGKGCRQLEAEQVIDAGSLAMGLPGGWTAFLGELSEHGARFTRVDLAVDDREGLLSLEVIEQSIAAGDIVSRFREGRVINDYDFRTGRQSGKTAYLGSPKSLMFVRIYDKAAQTGENFHWVRVELQARKERACQLVEQVIKHGLAAALSVLRNYVDFKVPGTTETLAKNNGRRPSAAWWLAFLDAAERLRLSTAPAVRTLQQIAETVLRQWGPGLAALMVSPAYGTRWLRGVVEAGGCRWRSKHYDMLAREGVFST
jgi:phage replication initiation protein